MCFSLRVWAWHHPPLSCLLTLQDTQLCCFICYQCCVWPAFRFKLHRMNSVFQLFWLIHLIRHLMVLRLIRVNQRCGTNDFCWKVPRQGHVCASDRGWKTVPFHPLLKITSLKYVCIRTEVSARLCGMLRFIKKVLNTVSHKKETFPWKEFNRTWSHSTPYDCALFFLCSVGNDSIWTLFLACALNS